MPAVTAVEIARAAARTKGTYFSAQFKRLAARQGKNRALVAVDHSILVVVYHVMNNRGPYHELGDDFLEKRNKHRLTSFYHTKLEKPGYDVSITPREAA